MVKNVFSLVKVMVVTVIFLSCGIAFGSEYDRGKLLYEEKCMICHGANGKGDGPAASALSPPPRDFSKPEFWNRENVDQIITNQVKNGKGSMPAFKLNEDEIKAIIDFMSHAFKKSE